MLVNNYVKINTYISDDGYGIINEKEHNIHVILLVNKINLSISSISFYLLDKKYNIPDYIVDNFGSIKLSTNDIPTWEDKKISLKDKIDHIALENKLPLNYLSICDYDLIKDMLPDKILCFYIELSIYLVSSFIIENQLCNIIYMHKLWLYDIPFNKQNMTYFMIMTSLYPLCDNHSIKCLLYTSYSFCVAYKDYFDFNLIKNEININDFTESITEFLITSMKAIYEKIDLLLLKNNE